MTAHVETLGPAPLDPRARQVMVPMRDGVHLATDVYLPDGPGPFPSVLVRLPYDKNGRYCWMPFIATHVIARGYAFVPQDVRGRFRSEGEPLAFVNEVEDGYDTIDWLAQQPWSNGAVGMWGDSYYGFTQWAAVAARHPALKAIVPRVTIADIDGWLEGVTPLYGAHYLSEFWSDHHSHEFAVDWMHRPLAGVFDEVYAAIGSRSASFDYVLERSRGGARRPLFPETHPFDALRIPTLHGVGWFDNISPPHMLDYEALVANPATAPFQYLHAGSTDHENYDFERVPIAAADDHAADDEALARMLQGYIGPALDFFDAFLTGRSAPRGRPARPLAPRGLRLAGIAELATARCPGGASVPRRCRSRRARRDGRLPPGRTARAGRGDVGPRPGSARALDARQSVHGALRVSGRARGRGARRRDDVHDRPFRRARHPRRPRSRTPRGGQ